MKTTYNKPSTKKSIYIKNNKFFDSELLKSNFFEIFHEGEEIGKLTWRQTTTCNRWQLFHIEIDDKYGIVSGEEAEDLNPVLLGRYSGNDITFEIVKVGRLHDPWSAKKLFALESIPVVFEPFCPKPQDVECLIANTPFAQPRQNGNHVPETFDWYQKRTTLRICQLRYFNSVCPDSMIVCEGDRNGEPVDPTDLSTFENSVTPMLKSIGWYDIQHANHVNGITVNVLDGGTCASQYVSVCYPSYDEDGNEIEETGRTPLFLPGQLIEYLLNLPEEPSWAYSEFRAIAALEVLQKYPSESFCLENFKKYAHLCNAEKYIPFAEGVFHKIHFNGPTKEIEVLPEDFDMPIALEELRYKHIPSIRGCSYNLQPEEPVQIKHLAHLVHLPYVAEACWHALCRHTGDEYWPGVYTGGGPVPEIASV